MYSRNQIESIATTDKQIVVNQVNKSFEIILSKNNRLYCTIWTLREDKIDSLIKYFLKTGNVDINQTGIWVI